jgi:hypothetical protein
VVVVVVVVVMGLSNLCTLKGLPKLPVWISNTRGGDSAIACGDHEPNALSHELPITLPILTPVSCHGVPTYTIPSDPHRRRPHSRSTHITIVTRLKNGFPLMVKRIVPLFTQVTLDSERIRSKTSTIRSAQGHELCDYEKKLSGASKHPIQKSRGEFHNTFRFCICTKYLQYATGMMLALYWPIFKKMGSAKSKCGLGRLHQPPLLEAWDQLGGQKSVAVTVMYLGKH